MYWWKVTHHLDYHSEAITEIRYIFAASTIEALDIISAHIHPLRVLTELYSISIEKTHEDQVDRGLIWDFNGREGEVLRSKLVYLALSWQNKMGVAPSITSTISEFDAAMLVGCNYEQYAQQGQNNTAVTKGYDFIYDGIRYQVKACRPSGKRGSSITKVPQARNYEWDGISLFGFYTMKTMTYRKHGCGMLNYTKRLSKIVSVLVLLT